MLGNATLIFFDRWAMPNIHQLAKKVGEQCPPFWKFGNFEIGYQSVS